VMATAVGVAQAVEVVVLAAEVVVFAAVVVVLAAVVVVVPVEPEGGAVSCGREGDEIRNARLTCDGTADSAAGQLGKRVEDPG